MFILGLLSGDACSLSNTSYYTISCMRNFHGNKAKKEKKKEKEAFASLISQTHPPVKNSTNPDRNLPWINHGTSYTWPYAKQAITEKAL